MPNDNQNIPLPDDFVGVDKYTFQKHVQVFDGRHIQVGKGTGTKIGTENTQKIGLFGVTPVVQPSNVTNASATIGSVTSQLNDLLSRLRDLGVIDSS